MESLLAKRARGENSDEGTIVAPVAIADLPEIKRLPVSVLENTILH
jgi:hypothetical protein